MDQNTTTIDDLPYDVLIEIFRNLSPKLLKVAALVCTRWNEIISTTSELLAHFKLNLTLGCVGKASNLRRKLSALKIGVLDSSFQQTIRFNMIRCLEIQKCSVDRIALTETLRQLEFLQSLSFEAVMLTESDASEPAELKNLVNLAIIYSSVEILETIVPSALDKFTFISEVDSTDSKLIVELLSNQPLLKHLKFEGTLKYDIWGINYPFVLESLTIEKVELMSVGDSFIRFLSIHLHNLQTLSLRCIVHDSVINLILEHTRSLKTLKLLFSMNNRPTSRIRQLDKVTDLELQGTLSSAGFKHLVNLFPALKSINVKSLVIRHFHLRNAVHSRGAMSHLSYLLTNQLLRYISEFHVDTIGCEDHFNNFVIQHADTLEVITISRIKDSEFSRGTVVDVISKCKRLKLLRFSSESPVVTRMFTKNTLTHPWVLETSFKSDRFNDIKLFFRFPDDNAVFRECCRTWDDDLIRDFSTCDNYGLNAFVNKFK